MICACDSWVSCCCILTFWDWFYFLFRFFFFFFLIKASRATMSQHWCSDSCRIQLLSFDIAWVYVEHAFSIALCSLPFYVILLSLEMYCTFSTYDGQNIGHHCISKRYLVSLKKSMTVRILWIQKVPGHLNCWGVSGRNPLWTTSVAVNIRVCPDPYYIGSDGFKWIL